MLRALTRKVRGLLNLPQDLRSEFESLRLTLGRIESRQVAGSAMRGLKDAEFQVFSQWGEDGIIDYLVGAISIAQYIFVEFGVQDYREANTRFLLQHRQWSGLVMDGSETNVSAIRGDPIYWRHNLKAHAAFVTRENVNSLIASQGISGDIGLLSIDIDGNDYWVWEALTCLSPRIVIVEYNSLFGPEARVTVPYQPDFVRSRAHYSNLYWGSSLGALALLAGRKGYSLVGSNSAGNNAFFVRNDCLGPLRSYTSREAYVAAHFRESRDEAGNLTFLDRLDALRTINRLPLFDLDKQAIVIVEQALLSCMGTK